MERIARIGPPDMRRERTGHALLVVRIVEILEPAGGQRLARAVSADDPCSDLLALLLGRQRFGQPDILPDDRIERRPILRDLADHQKAAADHPAGKTGAFRAR